MRSKLRYGEAPKEIEENGRKKVTGRREYEKGVYASKEKISFS